MLSLKNNTPTHRLLLGFWLPPFLGPLLNIFSDLFSTNSWEELILYSLTYLYTVFQAVLFVGVQAFILSIIFEKYINNERYGDLTVIAISVIFGIVIAIVPAILFLDVSFLFETGGVVGLVVGLILRYMYKVSRE